MINDKFSQFKKSMGNYMPKVELDLAQMQQINGINSDRIMTLLGNIYKLEKTYQAMTDKL